MDVTSKRPNQEEVGALQTLFTIASLSADTTGALSDRTTIDLGGSPGAVYLTAALWAIAREERKGKKPKRLVEPGFATWERFRGRMGIADFVDLVLEDAAVTQPEPFDAEALLQGVSLAEEIPDALLADHVALLGREEHEVPSREYVELQAACLGLRARPAFSDLPKLEANHHVLELPGTGGRLSAHLVLARPGLSFREGFQIACASWQERLLAGIVAVELGGKPLITLDPELHRARAATVPFTHVVGLKPEKGGAFEEHTLRGLFDGAEVKLV